MNKQFSFDTMPQMLAEIYDEVMKLRSILEKQKQTKEIPKHMCLEDAIQFLFEQGYQISKSRIYKKCASRIIPHLKFQGKLIFESKELMVWVENQLKNKTHNSYGRNQKN